MPPTTPSSSASSPLAPISLAKLTDFLHTQIPLTRSIGISVTAWDGRTVTLAAPLAPNQNHTDTAFGGSISSLAILAGYSLLYILLEERRINGRILVQKSAIEFLRPIDDDLRATATCPPTAILAEFLAMFPKKRRGRLAIESQIFSGQILAATHTGLYVAMVV